MFIERKHRKHHKLEGEEWNGKKNEPRGYLIQCNKMWTIQDRIQEKNTTNIHKRIPKSNQHHRTSGNRIQNNVSHNNVEDEQINVTSQQKELKQHLPTELEEAISLWEGIPLEIIPRISNRSSLTVSKAFFRSTNMLFQAFLKKSLLMTPVYNPLSLFVIKTRNMQHV